MTKTKKCSKCSVVKHLQDFNKDRTKKDGLEYQCKECKAETSRLRQVQKQKAYRITVLELTSMYQMQLHPDVLHKVPLTRFITLEENMMLVHTYKYTYSNSVYTGSHNLIDINCPKHGSFWQTPSSHLQGIGCPKCGTARMVESCSDSTLGFVEKANKVHSEFYSYSKTEYLNSSTSVTISCPTHGDFKQRPDSHLAGRGCQDCSHGGFKNSKPGLLYYLKVTTKNEILYKIGITNRSVKARFSVGELTAIKVLKETWYDDGEKCYNEEQRILTRYKEFKYIGPDVLKSGNTELFTKDILDADLTYSEQNLEYAANADSYIGKYLNIKYEKLSLAGKPTKGVGQYFRVVNQQTKEVID